MFVPEFYNRLLGLNGFTRLPLGRAFQEARQAIKQLDPANPTWLGYVLYGHPDTEVIPGEAEAAAPPVQPGERLERNVSATVPAESKRAGWLELDVGLDLKGGSLSFSLRHSADPQGIFRRFSNVSIGGDPLQYFQDIYDRLSMIARSSPKEERSAEQREITDLGANLYEQFMPADLRAIYPDLRDRYGSTGLHIVSEEPWIPWEMVRPFAVDERMGASSTTTRHWRRYSV